MHVSELRDALSKLKGLYDAAGAKAAVADLERLLLLLDGPGKEDFDQFIRRLEAELVKAIRPKEAVAPVQETVSRHYSVLTDAATNPGLFEQALRQLAEDKQAGKVEVDAIAHRYTNGRLHWKSRTEALAAIRTRFQERVYQESKMKLLAGFKPW